MGWVLWREPSDVPEDLVFHINYLGSGEGSAYKPSACVVTRLKPWHHAPFCVNYMAMTQWCCPFCRGFCRCCCCCCMIPPTDQASITLNFSRGAANVVGQYYQLLRLGRDGYTAVMSNLATIAGRLADGILETGGGCTAARPA
jgi:glutamate/tyrosine decarboxylase-like PLP-dependent enzyme